MNLPRHGVKDVRVEIYGKPGNSLANFNNGVKFIVYGNTQDDVTNTMHDSRVIIHAMRGTCSIDNWPLQI